MNTCNYPTPPARTNNEAGQTVERPRFRTTENEHGVSLQVALPGVRKEDVKLTLHESNLTIEADRSEGLPENRKADRNSNEARRYGLNVRLGARLDGTLTKASFKNGVLSLEVPLREDAKPRQIQVN